MVAVVVVAEDRFREEVVEVMVEVVGEMGVVVVVS